MRVERLMALALALSCANGTTALAQSANALLTNSDGKSIGNVALRQMEQGVHVSVRAEGLEPGVHAFHIHETGKCDSPDFSSAGGHFNPGGAAHGWNNPDGPHAGDLPNVHVQEDGVLAAEFFTTRVSLDGADDGLFDADGSAIVMHAGADDYITEPAGEAGKRIACGVITAPQ